MPRRKPVTPEPTERIHLDAQMLRCRIFGHAWDEGRYVYKIPTPNSEIEVRA